MEATGYAVRAGIEQGKKLGQQEGKQEGQVAMLVTLLQQRFGTLPQTAIATLRAASPTALEAIARRVLTCDTLDEALGG